MSDYTRWRIWCSVYSILAAIVLVFLVIIETHFIAVILTSIVMGVSLGFIWIKESWRIFDEDNEL